MLLIKGLMFQPWCTQSSSTERPRPHIKPVCRSTGWGCCCWIDTQVLCQGTRCHLLPHTEVKGAVYSGEKEQSLLVMIRSVRPTGSHRAISCCSGDESVCQAWCRTRSYQTLFNRSVTKCSWSRGHQLEIVQTILSGITQQLLVKNTLY